MTETIFTVTENKKLCTGIFKLTLKTDNLEEINCGQFINIEIPGRKDLLLRRPFAICGFDSSKNTLAVCFRVVGTGTQQLAAVTAGEKLRGTYPLGNGFNLSSNHKTVALIGGGAGIFPLLSVFKCYGDRKIHTFLGFKNRENAILIEEFEKYSKEVLISTEDGSLGASGYVTDSLKRNIDRIKPDIILACGPAEMYKSLKAALKGYPDIPVLISLEERMGCGIGACLVCACALQGRDGLYNKRVCRDGPIFNLNEVVL